MSEPDRTPEILHDLHSQPARPGIQFTGVVLERLVFSDIEPGAPKPKSLQFAFGIRRRTIESPPAIEVTIFLKISPPPDVASKFSLEAEVTGRFQQIDPPGAITLDVFSKTNGPALVMPYAREVVTNVTARTRHGPIFFPPVNVVALVAEEQRFTEPQDESPPSDPAP